MFYKFENILPGMHRKQTSVRWWFSVTKEEEEDSAGLKIVPLLASGTFIAPC
jgi:hypothetical protein